jgi:hypothetical protein
MTTGFQLSIANDGTGWKSYVRIHQPDGNIWESKDDCETLNHAAAMAIVQFQAWIENQRGLPPVGVKFGHSS